MKRRDFLRGAAIIPVAGIVSPVGSSRALPQYKRPFEEYSEYITRLEQSVGQEVRVQDCFRSSPGDKRKLIEVKRISHDNTNLYPHSVSFYDGTTINLRSIAQIYKPDAFIPPINVNPFDEGLLYLDIPGQKDFQKFMRRQLDIMMGNFHRHR